MHGSLSRSYSAESSAERLRDQVCLALRAAAVSRICTAASSSVAGVPRCLPAHLLCRRCGDLARPGSTAARRSRGGSILTPMRILTRAPNFSRAPTRVQIRKKERKQGHAKQANAPTQENPMSNRAQPEAPPPPIYFRRPSEMRHHVAALRAVA